MRITTFVPVFLLLLLLSLWRSDSFAWAEDHTPSKRALDENVENQSLVVTNEDLAKAAEEVYLSCEASQNAGIATLSDVHYWSLKWATTEIEAHRDNANVLIAYKNHLARMNKLYHVVKASETAMTFEIRETKYYVLEAKRFFADAQQKAKGSAKNAK